MSWKSGQRSSTSTRSATTSRADTEGLELPRPSAPTTIGDGWGLVGHVGSQKLKNKARHERLDDAQGSITDWKLGVTKDMGGWSSAPSTSTPAKRADRREPLSLGKAKERQQRHGRDFGQQDVLIRNAREGAQQMKLVTAIIKPFKLDEVREALSGSACRASP